MVQDLSYASQLNQVFLNLLANAIDAIEEANASRTQKEIEASPGQITIRTRRINQNCVSIEISDNGGGIPENIKTRIFDPFFTSKEIGKGTGLGLSISYQIVTDKHNGQLECYSIPDTATEFIVKIPVTQGVLGGVCDVEDATPHISTLQRQDALIEW